MKDPYATQSWQEPNKTQILLSKYSHYIYIQAIHH